MHVRGRSDTVATMRAAVALTISASLLAGACFPNNAKHRMYAQLGEGGALVAGIGLLYLVNSGADCDMMSMPGGEPDDSCKTKATVLGDIGLGLILVGLIGFIATVSTSEDDKQTSPVTTKPKVEAPKPDPTPVPTPAPTPTPTPTPDPATPPPADGAGSAATP